jgi:hypothetical protein
MFNFLMLFNIFATIERQGDGVLLEKSFIRHSMYMANMTTVESSCTAIEQTQHLLNKLHSELQEESKHGLGLPVIRKLNLVTARHPPMFLEYHTM